MKTVTVYHRIDADGWASAAIVKHWWHEEGKKGGSPNSEPRGIMDYIGYHYGDPIPDLSQYDKVIMVDISFPKQNMLDLNITKELIYIDHHANTIKTIFSDVIEDSIKGLRNSYEGDDSTKKEAACELTWKYFFPDQPMPEFIRLLGSYDCFRHKGGSEEKMVLEFQYGARSVISDMDEAYSYLLKTERADVGTNVLNQIWDAGKSIYAFLCVEALQTYKNGFVIVFEETHSVPAEGGHPASVTISKRKFIAFNKERFNPINFGIDYHVDGYDGAACFWYANGKFNFSLYNDNGKVNCASICKQFGGGGHKSASGCIMSMNQFQELIG